MKKFIPLIFLLLLIELNVKAQETLFQTDSILHFTLTADFQDLFNHRYEEKYSVDGKVTIDHTDVVNAPIKIGVRGNFRRDEENCSFPPIFIKNKSSSPEVDHIKKIKLVTHCQDDPYFQQFILKEYLAYRIYHQLTDASFRVRLCKITYMDGEKEILTRFGFLIEENKKLAKRLQSKRLKNLVLGEDIPKYRNVGLISFFELMIGNTDWYIPDHNIMVFNNRESGDTIAIPYDFDLSGLVNKPNAEPRSGLGITRVTDRYYLGHCWESKEIKRLIILFNEKRVAIETEIKKIKDFDESSKADIRSYIDEFYLLLNDPEQLQSTLKTCNSYY
jgi:hypothetical protein